jgi:hypothetical protein
MASTGRAKSKRARPDRRDKAGEGAEDDRRVQALQSIHDQLLEIAARLAFVAATAGVAAKRK